MKILVIFQYYRGAGEPGGSRFNEFARLWQAAGHQVTIVAGSLSYSTGETLAGLNGRWVTRREEDGVTVWRCRVPTTYNRGYLGRMWAFLGFTLSSAMAVLRAERPDVVIATSPPLVTALVGWLAARRHAVPWVFEIRDLWPESAVTTGVLREDSILTRLLYRVERFGCGRANRINVLTPAFEEDLRRRGLATADKIVFIPNGADLDSFSPGPRENEMRAQLGWGNRFVALYAGAHGRANALLQLVEAAACLQERPDILIACVGDGPDRKNCEVAASTQGLSNIIFLGPYPKEAMPALINASDAGLAVLQRNPTFTTVYPNKVFDYMAAAKPSVVAIDGVARRLVCEEARAGLFAEPEDGEAIAHALVQLADDSSLRGRLGENGRNWVVANASRASLAEKYVDALRPLVSLNLPAVPSPSAL